MRAISKRTEPRELLDWKAENAGTPSNLAYGGGSFPGEQVRRSLLHEQKHLCAYTMKRLRTAVECHAHGQDTRESCHIEHVLPQSRKVIGEDIDYRNLVACYPPSRSTVACAFGAVHKADFDPETGRYVDRLAITGEKAAIEVLAIDARFVSPLDPLSDRHFDFKEDGNVKGKTASGRLTIKVLNLDHPQLVNERISLIKGALRPRGCGLSAAAARRLASRIQQADAENCLSPHYIAVASAAEKWAEREERRSARMRKKGSR